MPEIATGIFIILAAMGFGSLIISHKLGALFAVIDAVSFFAISLYYSLIMTLLPLQHIMMVQHNGMKLHI